MRKYFHQDFYEIQRKQWKKSLFLFLVLILFYFAAVGLISILLVITFSLLLNGSLLPSKDLWIKLFFLNSAVSLIIAALHFYEAKRFGPGFILKRLDARPPDLSDRYHKQFANTVEEIRIASGLPRVKPYIIPAFAINSLALILRNKTPAVIVSEGLLAEYTRDELQAVVSHELAHVIRGDAFYLTLVCSLANLFEKLRQSLEPEGPPSSRAVQSEGGAAPPPLIYLALTLSAIIMHMLSTLISREREILADSTAVELCRHPRALARAIYKAHLKNSFIGDFNLTYSPLFLVPPESRGITEGFFSRLFSSHPPLMNRIHSLADMTNISPAEIIEEVWEIQRNREKARIILPSHEKTGRGITPASPAREIVLHEEGKVWSIRDPKGNTRGPFALEELLFLRFFSPLRQVKNLQEGVEAPAQEFPQIREALRNMGSKKTISPAKKNRCPRCSIPLREAYYEGVAVKACPQCRGKLIDSAVMERIIARKEWAFSDDLIRKAEEFRKRFMINPFQKAKINAQKSQSVYCPHCGTRMLLRPYTYQYIVQVDKCLSCYKIWFDPDELEILQILIEAK